MMFLVLVSGMGRSSHHHLSILGATSVLAYVRAAVPGWEDLHPGYTVSITGGGSVAGLVEVSRGRTDIGVSDVPAIREWTGDRPLQRQVLGRLPILFVVHPGLGLHHLTRDQLAWVLMGRVANWDQLGGHRVPVVVMSRALSSGALYVVDHKILVEGRMTSRAIIQLSNGAVLAAVRETPGAVGFVESGSMPQGVTVLHVGPFAYDGKSATDWPYYAIPTLYFRGDATPEVRSLVRYLASRPYRSSYGLEAMT